MKEEVALAVVIYTIVLATTTTKCELVSDKYLLVILSATASAAAP